MTPADLSHLTSSEPTAVAPPPSRWKTRVLLPSIIAAAVLALLAWSAKDALLPATPVRVVPVVVKSVEGRAGAVTVQAPGWLEPDPHPVFIAALTPGVIESVLVLEGDTVSEGQIVATLIDDDAQLMLRQAEASLQSATANRDVAHAEMRAAEEQLETLVDRHQILQRSEARVAELEATLDEADAARLAAEADLALARDEYTRKDSIADSRAVSEAAIERLRLKVESLEAAAKAAAALRPIAAARLDQARADVTAAQQHLELLIEEERAVDLARARLAGAEAAITMAQAKRDEATLRVERMQVVSPVDGVVMRRLVSPGSRLVLEGEEHAGHVLHAYRPDRLQVRVDVPLADAASVSVGQRAEVTVEVLPDRVFRGELTRIVHRADIQKNTVEVKVRIDEPIDTLKPDMLARVRFIGTSTDTVIGGVRNRVFAPESLVSGGQAMVVVDRAAGVGRVAARPITTGATVIDNWIEVLDGLQPGDMLVENGEDITDGDRVRIVGETGGAAWR